MYRKGREGVHGETAVHAIEHFCCRNPKCPDYGIRAKGNLRHRGWSGVGKRIRMLYCRTCGARFSERKGTILERAHLPPEKVVSILEHLREGCGTRPTSRLLRVNKNTVTRYVRLSGAHACQLHDELVAFSPGDQGAPARRAVELRGQEGSAL